MCKSTKCSSVAQCDNCVLNTVEVEIVPRKAAKMIIDTERFLSQENFKHRLGKDPWGHHVQSSTTSGMMAYSFFMYFSNTARELSGLWFECIKLVQLCLHASR